MPINLNALDISNFNCLFVLGATASGKSSFALQLAKKYNGVVINADSMQIYRGVDTLTAVPSITERDGVEHRLYSVLNPNESCDVIKWREMALREIDDVLAQGKLPILCGGTGFYATAMTKGLSPIPDVDDTVRMAVRKMQTAYSSQDFYKVLQETDTAMAKKLTVGDTQRIARALEIFKSTGKSLAHYQNLPTVKIPEHIKLGLIALIPPRQKIYDTINNRFDAMVDSGGLAEVRVLMQTGIDATYQIGRAIGVRELMDFENGVMTLEQAIEKSKTNTRRYAKRQLTYINTQLTADIVVEL